MKRNGGEGKGDPGVGEDPHDAPPDDRDEAPPMAPRGAVAGRPRHRPAVARERAGTVRSRSRARRPKVLIADPNPDVLESTAILVANLGYEPVPVDQPVDLLEIVEEVQPGLVLLETQFPGLNVAGFVAALRAHGPTATIPLAFFSASKDLAATTTRHQAWGMLAKPFALRELAQLLEAALGPSPAMKALGGGNVEREVRDAFREFRNLITAFSNYLAMLQSDPALSRPSRLAVLRLGDIALKMEARSEHMRSFVLGFLLPEPEEPAPPRTPARNREARSDEDGPWRHPKTARVSESVPGLEQPNKSSAKEP